MPAYWVARAKVNNPAKWSAEEPNQSQVRFQVRVAPSRRALERAPWLGPSGEGSEFSQRGSSLKFLPPSEWIQYRAILDTGKGARLGDLMRHAGALEASLELGRYRYDRIKPAERPAV